MRHRDEDAEDGNEEARGDGRPGDGPVRSGASQGQMGGFAAAPAAPVTAEARLLVAQGAVGGLLAGAGMLLVAMVTAFLLGQGFFTPARLAAATVYGPAAMAGAAPAALGVLLYLATAALLGVMFALAVATAWPGVRPPDLLAWGLAYGAVVWLMAHFVVLPVANPLMAAAMPPFLFLLFHLIYGGVLGAYLGSLRE